MLNMKHAEFHLRFFANANLYKNNLENGKIRAYKIM